MKLNIFVFDSNLGNNFNTNIFSYNKVSDIIVLKYKY